MLTNSEVLRMIFGFKVRYLRLRTGLGYQELAKKSGLSVSYLNDIEKGKKYPKPDKVETLALALGITYDELVSIKSDAKIQPIIDLVNSDFFKDFPMEEFGISFEKLLDVFTNAPDRTYAFIITIIKMVRSYQIEKEHFFRVALRSYQDIHDNYFKDLEDASLNFKQHHWPNDHFITNQELVRILTEQFNVTIDRQLLGKKPKLSQVRSFFDPLHTILYLNKDLDNAQERFIMARELGFHHLDLKDRPTQTVLERDSSFEKLLNNYKASYFSAALLLPEANLVERVSLLLKSPKWNPGHWLAIVREMDISPEMLLQRLTNLLPKHFGLKHLFFIRLNEKEPGKYAMTKELHLSQLHSPYRNLLEEQFCRRWVSIRTIQQVQQSDGTYLIDAQVSDYHGSDHSYFVLTIAQNRASDRSPNSVTLGLLITQTLRAEMHFLDDPDLRREEVNITCERCPLSACQDRAAPPNIVHRQREEEALAKELDAISQINT